MSEDPKCREIKGMLYIPNKDYRKKLYNLKIKVERQSKVECYTPNKKEGRALCSEMEE